MKSLWMLALMFCGGVLMAGTDVDINGKFTGSTVGDLAPKKWTFNKSIRPEGTGKVVQVGDKLGVQITNTKKSVAYYSRHVAVKPGEKYELSCDAAGTGKACLGVYYYKAAGGWVGAVMQTPVVLKEGKNELKFEVTVPAEMDGKVPGYASFVFCLRDAGEATFTDVELEKEDAK